MQLLLPAPFYLLASWPGNEDAVVSFIGGRTGGRKLKSRYFSLAIQRELRISSKRLPMTGRQIQLLRLSHYRKAIKMCGKGGSQTVVISSSLSEAF